MPIIQEFPAELDYCNAKLHPLASKVGSFLELFLHACLRADSGNYSLLRPILIHYMEYYPADQARLEAERLGNSPAPVKGS